MTEFESLFRSKLSVSELAGLYYDMMIEACIARHRAQDAADAVEVRGRAAVVRAMEDFTFRWQQNEVRDPPVMIGWYGA